MPRDMPELKTYPIDNWEKQETPLVCAVLEEIFMGESSERF